MKQNSYKTIFAMIFIVLTLVLTSNLAEAETNISACQNISSAGYYVLNQSINGSGACLNISSSNVTIDCNYFGTAYKLNGTRAANNFGIWFRSRQNITIVNCTIYNFYQGIYSLTSGNNTYLHNNISNNVRDGLVLITTSNNNTVINNTFTYNGYGADTYAGVLVSGSSNNTFINNTANWNGRSGIYLLSSSNNNNLTNNTMNYNWGHAAVYISTTSNNNSVTYNWFYNNSQKAVETGTSSNYNYIAHNTAIGNSTLGIYIYSNYNTVLNNTINGTINGGIYNNGNHSSFINNTIHSLKDGITMGYATNNTYSNNTIICASGREGIGITVLIPVDIKNYVDSNNTINGKPVKSYNDVQEPCPNNTVLNFDDSYSLIMFLNCKNVSVNNATVTQGIYMFGTNNSVVNNVTSNFTRFGVKTAYSSNNVYSNNVFTNVSSSAFELYSSTGIILTNNTLYRNNDAFSMQECSNITVANNSVVNSSGNVAWYYLSSNSLFYNNTFNGNGDPNFYIYESTNATLINNTFNGSYTAINVYASNNNTIKGNLINVSADNVPAIYFDSSNYSNISNNNILSTGTGTAYAIQLNNSHWNNITDSVFNASVAGVADIYSEYAGMNNFTNCTFNKSDTSFRAGATGSINIFWYAEAYVNDTSGSPISGANVTIKDVNSVISNWSLTNSSGYSSRVVLREYKQNVTSKYYDTNYTFNGSKLTYIYDDDSINLTVSKVGKDITLTLSKNYTLTDCSDINIAGVYTLGNDIISTGTCINITVANVILDCNGKTINFSSSDTGYGITSNSTNTTIKNCIIKKTSSAVANSVGILLNASNYNGLIFNNSIYVSGTGDYGIFSNNTLEADIYYNNITASTSANTVGLILFNSQGVNASNNKITNTGASGEGMAVVTNSINNYLYYNNISTTGSYGYGIIFITNSYYNTVDYSTIKTTASYAYGFYFSDGANNNTIKSSTIEAGPGLDIFSNNVLGTPNTFTNCSISKADIDIFSGRVDVYWYVDVYANNSAGAPFENVNITIKNVSGSLVNYSLTNSSGYIGRLTLREFLANSTGLYYDTNYSFNASLIGYTEMISSINLTSNKIADNSTLIFFTLSNLSLTQTGDSFAEDTAYKVFTLYLNTTDPSIGDASASFWYNGVNYVATKTIVAANSILFTKTLIIPNSTGNSTGAYIPWFWNYNTTLLSTRNSTTQYQTVISWEFVACNSSVDKTLVNFSFKDEYLGTNINATMDSLVFIYNLPNSTVYRTLTYTNTSYNYYYAFCASKNVSSINVTGTVQFSNSVGSYPQRRVYLSQTYINTSVTNTTLYLLPLSSGVSTNFLVINIGNQVISGAYIKLEREISGVIVEVASGYTDDSGGFNAFLNPYYSHTITVSKAGYSTQTQSITPTAGTYTITMGTSGGYYNYSSNLEGISWVIWPPSGLLQINSTYNFTYYVSSRSANIYNCTMILRYFNGSIKAQNTGCNTSTPNTGGLVWVVTDTNGTDAFFGEYYVNINGNETVIERDARWVLVDINATSGSVWASMKEGLRSLIYLPEWGGDCPEGYTLNETDLYCYNTVSGGRIWRQTADFSRILFFFIVLAIVLAALNFFTGYDTAYPGSFLYFMSGIVLIMSSVNGPAGPGYFYLSGAISDSGFFAGFANIINNWIVFFNFALVTAIYWFTTHRRYQG